MDGMKEDCSWHVAVLCSDNRVPAADNRGGDCEGEEEEQKGNDEGGPQQSEVNLPGLWRICVLWRRYWDHWEDAPCHCDWSI